MEVLEKKDPERYKEVYTEEERNEVLKKKDTKRYSKGYSEAKDRRFKKHAARWEACIRPRRTEDTLIEEEPYLIEARKRWEDTEELVNDLNIVSIKSRQEIPEYG